MRRARPADAGPIRDLHLASIRGLGPEAYDDDQVAAWAHDRDPSEYPIDDPDTDVLVAETAGTDRLVGFGWIDADPGEYLSAAVEAELTALYVHPEFVRRGVGTRLCRALEDRLRTRGTRAVGLWATLVAVDFYRARGYERVVDRAVTYGEATLPTVEMHKWFE